MFFTIYLKFGINVILIDVSFLNELESFSG